MSDVKYSVEQVTTAARQGLGEVYGNDSPAIDVLTSRVLGHLVLDGGNVTPPSDAELSDFSKPPRYAERAISTSSPEELAALAGEACERLRRSLAPYLNDNDRWSEHELLLDGVYRLNPWIFKEGGRSGEGGSIVGDLHIHADLFGNGGGFSYGDRTVLSMELKGGEDAPYNKFDEDKRKDLHSERLLEIREKTVYDPISKANVPVMYVTAQIGYGDETSRDRFGLYKGKERDPYLVAAVKADVFWALDMAITYYEEVYVTFQKWVGLSYADYRDAGCLDDQGYIDREKAKAYVLSQTDKTDEESAGSPELGNWDTKVVAMNADARARVEAYRSRLV